MMGNMIRILIRLLALLVFAAVVRAGEPPFASVKPAPRIEYWQNRLSAIESSLRDPSSLRSVRLVFLGDSITDFWTMGDNLWFPGKRCGLAIWNESFSGTVPENRGFNLGVSGDRTEHVLFRILPKSEGGLGELDSPDLDPDFVILLVGINNSWASETPATDSIFQGIRAVVSAVHARKPRARVILETLLPTNDEGKNRDTVRPVNDRLRGLATEASFSGYVTILDLYPVFVDASGAQLGSLFNDGLHPNQEGYARWRDRLVPLIQSLRSGKS